MSSIDERMDGEKKDSSEDLPLAACDLYQLVSYLSLEPQQNPGKPSHMFELNVKITNVDGG